MPPVEGTEIILAGIRADRDDKLYQMWLMDYQHMTKENYISFKQFRDNLTGANIDRRSDAEIIAEAEETERRFKNGN